MENNKNNSENKQGDVSASDLLQKLKKTIAQNPVTMPDTPVTADEAKSEKFSLSDESIQTSDRDVKKPSSVPVAAAKAESDAIHIKTAGNNNGSEHSSEKIVVNNTHTAVSKTVKTEENVKSSANGKKTTKCPTVYHYTKMSKAEYIAQQRIKKSALVSDRYKGFAEKTDSSAVKTESKSPVTTESKAKKPVGAAVVRQPNSELGELEARIAKKRDKNVRSENVDLASRIKDAEAYADTLPDTKNRKNKHDDELDETDVNLMIAFGMDKELKAKVGEDKASEIEATIDKNADTIENSIVEGNTRSEKKHFEFTATAQAKKIFAHYKKIYHGLLWRFISCVILMIITFFYENLQLIGGTLPTPLNPLIYPVVHILIGLQLLVLCGAIIYKPLYNGMLALFRFKPIPESMTFVLMAVTFIYHIALCFIPAAGGPVLYNFPVAICVFFTVLYEFMNLRREIYSFNIASSKRIKQVVEKVDLKGEEPEAEAFYDYVPENPVIFKVKKTSFVDGFYKKMRAYPKSKMILAALIPLVAAVSLIFAFAGYFVGGSLYDGLRIGYLMLVMAMPLSVLVTYSYPFYKASKDAFGNDSAIIGEASLEEYAAGAAISFDDKEVFPSVGVKVKTVQVVGKHMIDEVMYYASCVFSSTGGPLADVLDIATMDIPKSDDVQLREVSENGIDAVVDGKRIFVGKAEYMQSRNIVPINPSEDENIESGGEVCVMYIAVGNNIAAKFYLQYIIDTDFEFILRQLYKAGLCIGIKTFDPNINDRMLSARIRLSKYPVRVIKCASTEKSEMQEERSDSAVITRGNAKNLLATLTLCDRVLHVTKTNIVVKIFSIIISIVIMSFVLMMGKAGDLTSVLVALYQVFWIVPMVIIAKLLI